MICLLNRLPKHLEDVTFRVLRYSALISRLLCFSTLVTSNFLYGFILAERIDFDQSS